jgi:hypothetical protein
MYSKIFASMYDGTLRTRSPWEATVTLQQLLILSDSHGQVDMTPEAIALRTGIPLEIIRKGIVALEVPDPDSRLPNEEGRRIVRIDPRRDWGWKIVNFIHYRDLKSENDRREYQKNLMRERRAKEKADREQASTVSAVSIVSGPLAPVSNVRTHKTQTKTKTNTFGQPDGFPEFYSAYPRRVARREAERAWSKLNPNGDLRRRIHAALEIQRRSIDWTKDGGKYVPYPASWLNDRRWEDEYQVPPTAPDPDERTRRLRQGVV